MNLIYEVHVQTTVNSLEYYRPIGNIILLEIHMTVIGLDQATYPCIHLPKHPYIKSRLFSGNSQGTWFIGVSRPDTWSSLKLYTGNSNRITIIYIILFDDKCSIMVNNFHEYANQITFSPVPTPDEVKCASFFTSLRKAGVHHG